MPAPRILVTRPPHQASPLAEALRAAGLDPILIPTIELALPDSYAPLDEAIANLASYHWLLFTSANAVEAFAQRLLSPPHNSVILSEAQRSRRTPTKLDSPNPPEPFPPHLPPTLLIAAIGPATAQALQLLGTKPTLIPPASRSRIPRHRPAPPRPATRRHPHPHAFSARSGSPKYTGNAAQER